MLELHASIWLVDESAKVLRAEAATELVYEKIGNYEIPLDAPNVGIKVVRTSETEVVEHIKTNEKWQFRDEISRLGLKSAVVAPLRIKSRTAGVLVVYIPEDKPCILEDLKPKVEISADQIAATLRHIKGLETLSEVGQLINSEMQSPALFKRVLESVQQVLDCEHISIFSAENGDLELTETSSPYVKKKHFKAGEGLAGEVIQTKCSLLIPDVRNNPKFVKGLSMDIEERSMLLTPIMSENQVIGIISCDFHGLDGFDRQDQMLLETLTRYIFTALQNRELYQKEHDKAQALSELHEIANGLLSIETVSDSRNLLKKIARISKKVLKADIIELYEYRQDQDEYEPSPIIEGQRIGPATKKVYGEDAVFSLIRRSAPLYVGNAQTSQGFTEPYTSLRKDQPEERYVIREKIQSFAVIPLRTGNENTGLMFANYRKPQIFSEEQKELITLFAGQAAMAIKNARLYHYVNQRRKAMVDIGEKLSGGSHLNENEVLELIYRQAADKLNMKNFFVALHDEEKNMIRFALASSEGKRVSVNTEEGWKDREWSENHKIEKIIRTRKPLLLNTLKEIEEKFGTRPDKKTAKSWIGVPMHFGQKILGVVASYNYEKEYSFSKDDVEIFQAMADLASISIENARLYAQHAEDMALEKQREAQIEAVHQISRSIASPSEINRILDNILDWTIKLMGKANLGEIRLLDKKTDELVAMASQGQPVNEKYRRVSVNEGITGWVARNRLSQLVKDVSEDTRYLQFLRGTGSEIVVPILKGWEVIGVLNIEHPQVDAFSEKDVKLAESIANLTSIAIDNSRLYEKLQKQKDAQIEAIGKISASIVEQLEISQVLKNILDRTISLMTEGALGEIRLLDKNTNEPVAECCTEDNYENEHVKIQVGKGITGWVAQNKKAQLIRDVSKDERYLPFRKGIRSELCVPILKDKELIGVINIEHHQLNAFTDDDLKLTEAIANLAAATIDNARLYEQLKKRTAELKAAYEISEAAHDIGSLKEFYPKIYEIIKELIPYAKKNFRIGVYVKDSFEIVYCEDERENLSSEKLLKGLTGYVLRNAQPLICNPIERNDLVKKGEIQVVGVPSASWLGVPLKIQGNCIGVIVAQSYDEKFTYGEEEKNILIFVAEQVAMAIQRMRSQEELKKLNHQQKVLINLGQKLTSALQLKENEILELIYENTYGLSDNMYIALYDEVDDYIRFPLAYEKGEPEIILNRKAGQGRTEEVIHTRKPIFIKTKKESEEWYNKPGRGRYIHGEGPSASWIGVPMVISENVLGVVSIYHPEDNVYNEDDLENLQAMANIVAIALDNARLYKELVKHHEYLEKLVEERAVQLKAAYKISEAAHTARKLDVLYPELHKIINDLMPARNFFIALYDSGSDTVSLPFFQDEYDDTLPVNDIKKKGLTGYVLRNGRPLLATPDKFAKLELQGEVENFGTRSVDWLGVPLKTQKETIGILAVQSYSEEVRYSETDKDILVFVSEQIAMAIERVHAEEQLKKHQDNLEKLVKERTKQLQVAYEISEITYHVKNLEEFYESVHIIISKLMPAKNFRIITFNPDGKISGFLYFVDQKDKYPNLQREIIEKGKAGYVFRTGEPLLIKDRQDNESRLKGKIHMLGTRAESWLGVPLKIQNRTVGVLTVYDYDKSVYSESEKDILMFVSNQIAMSIERVQANEELIQRTTQLNAAYRISEATHKAQNLDELYPEIYKIVRELMPIENFYISFFNPSTNTLSFPYFINNKGEFPPESMPIERGFSGYIMQTQKPLFGSPEVIKRHVEDGKIIPVTKRPVSFWLGVPLKTQKRTIGVLAAYDHDGKVIYSEDDLDILVFVSEQIAMAIERVRTNEELNKFNVRLNAIYEISEATHTAKNLDELYRLIHHVVSTLMPAKNFYIAIYDNTSDSIKLDYYKDEKVDLPTPSGIFGKGLTGYVLRTGKPLLASPEILEELVSQGEVEKTGGQSIDWLGVPLKVSNKAIGVLAVKTYDPEIRYTETEKDILVFVSEQIATAIKRVQLEEKSDELNHRKEILITLAQKLASSIQLEEDEIFVLIKENIHKFRMELDNMYIALYDEVSDLIRFPLIYKNAVQIAVPERKAGKGRTEEIIHTRQPIFIHTREESKEWYSQPGRKDYINDPLASWIGVPMIVGKKVLGVVATYDPERDYVYSENDLEILHAMANIAAIALENARLYQQLAEKIADLTKAQNEIADRERELVKGGFAIDLIHKMNNIAGTIPPWVSLIKRKLGSDTHPKVNQYLGNIVRDTSYILKEANELREHSAIPELIDMEEATGSIIIQTEMMTPPDIVFNFEVDSDLFCVHGIKEHLSVAIHSIIMNSVKATSEQGEISIILKNLIKETKKYIEISISDTGCGIPQDEIDCVFEYGTSLWHDKQGTGYGLWRARSIIQTMKGSIQITHTEIGKGTTFTIILPAVETDRL